MARKIDEVTRTRLIEFVGDYFIKTGLSAREIEQKMGDSKCFTIVPSHVTISKYIQEYKLIHHESASIIDSLVEDQKGSRLDDPAIIERVYSVANAIFNGKSIQELSFDYTVSYWVIYRDVHLRLRQLDNQLYMAVCERLKENSKVK